MLAGSPIRLISRAWMDGLAIPVTVVNNKAPKSCGFRPALCSAMQSACSPNSYATLIQMSLA